MSRRTVFSAHSAKRMFQRSISVDDVLQVLASGEVIEDYPNDFPYPSKLLLAQVSGRPIHMVIADNVPDNETIVVTLYEPDPQKWDSEFKRRMP